MATRLFRKHREFFFLLILFVQFRALTLLAYRPGGPVLDFSDFYWYREYAQLSRQGYVAFQSLWSAYPPLFPVAMVNLWKLSATLPPWNFDNLWFTLLFGGVLLLFEVGTLAVLYAIARKLYPPATAMRPVWLYALLFVPVYTMTGHFEGVPIFFFMLGLYLLLENRPYLSAFFGGVGFMTKLLPVLLLPVGVQLLPPPKPGGKTAIHLPALNLSIDIKRALAYAGIFAATIIAIGLPFYRMNPHLIAGSILLNQGRPSWETVWALLEGNFGYGVVPLDLRDLAWRPMPEMGSPLPWGWITLAFAVLGAFLYTRRINWRQPRVAVAFAGLTVAIFFLYSKGYSPQWLGWLLIFIALLLPNLRGAIYAGVLSAVNIIEGNVFFVMFPAEHWLLAATVIIRTTLIVALGMEFGLIIWPRFDTPALQRWRRRALGIGLAALVVLSVPAAGRLRTAYVQTRLEQSPYGQTIRWLREQPVTEAILLNDHSAYNWFYPYLRQTHGFFMLDDYADATTTVAAKTTALLNGIAAEYNAVWVFDADPAVTTPAEEAAAAWLASHQLAHQADIDGGRLYLYILKND